MRRLLLFLGLLVPSLAAAPAALAAPVSSHSMLYACCTPFEMKERIFAESKALGANYIRVDVQMNSIFESYGMPAGEPDWSGLDEVMALSRKYRLPVLGIILHAPSYMTTCPGRWPDSHRCGAADPEGFGRLAGEIAAHARGVIDRWEILNEPDAAWAFEGTPEEYAHMLRASHDHIRARVPEAQVVFGGVATTGNSDWVDRVFATPGADAIHKFQIANLHLRGRVDGLGGRYTAWRALLARHGFTGPAWVTEHGYPADPAHQQDPAFTGGDPAQARYLRASILALADAGAEQVFVTLRDNLEGEYATEGVVDIDEVPGYPARRRLSFEAVRTLATGWDQVLAWRAEQRELERRKPLQEAGAGHEQRLADVAALGLANARSGARRVNRSLRRARLRARASRPARRPAARAVRRHARELRRMRGEARRAKRELRSRRAASRRLGDAARADGLRILELARLVGW